MKPGDIVTNRKYGLMLVLEKEKRSGTKAWRVSGAGTEKQEAVILEDFLSKVPQPMVQEICSIDQSSLYSNTTRERGQDYFKKRKVGVISDESGSSFSAAVRGTQSYVTTLLYNKGSEPCIIPVCTCPVGTCCKHAAALTYALKDKITKLKEQAGFEGSSLEAQLTGQPVAKQFSHILADPLTEEKVRYGLDKLILHRIAHSEDIARMLDKFIHGPSWISGFKQNIFYGANLLPDGEYFYEYIRAEFLRDSSCNVMVNMRKKRPANVDDAALYRYFHIGWQVVRENNKVFLLYKLLSPEGNNVLVAGEEQKLNLQGLVDSEDDQDFGYYGYHRMSLSYYYNDTSLTYRLYDDNPRLLYSVYASTFANNVANLVIMDVKAEFGSEIEAEIEKHKEEIEKELELERRKKLKASMSALSSALDKHGVKLNARAQAELVFSFTGNPPRDGIIDLKTNGLSVEMRIGINRKYIVRDILEFLDRFRSGETHQYGKEFTFTHRIENIKENQQKALRVLSLASSGYVDFDLHNGKKGLPLDSGTAEALLSALEGTRVEFYGAFYNVTLEPIQIRVAMDSSFRLHLETPAKGFYLLSTEDTFFFINVDERTIQKANITPEEKDLILFARKNENTSFESVLDEFSDVVYSRFASSIDLDEAIASRIKVSSLEINAYFDFQDGIVSVREEYVRDGVKINEQDFSASDKNRVAGYENCLARLGFEENTLTEDADILNFFAMDMSQLKSFCNVYLSDSIRNKELQSFRTQTVRIQYQNNIMHAFLEDSDYSDRELREIFKAIRRKKKYALLSGERIVDLRGEDAAELQATVSDLGIDENAPSQPVQLPISKALRAFAHEKGCRIDDMLKNMVRDIREFKSSTIPVPPVNAVLRPYQEEGFRWLRILSDYQVGGILADDMGLGKTLQIITLLKSDETPAPSLVVCPKSLVFNWVNEFRRFDPDALVTEVYGNASQRHEIINQLDRSRKVCLVTSYDSLRSDAELYDFPVNYMVLDEAQYIKNVNAQKSRSVKQIKAAHKLALTGTPIENNVLDLWSIFDFIMPGYLDELSSFKKAYNSNEAYTRQIARRIAPFLLRRTKKDVLTDLPDKYERVMTSEMTEDQRKVYDAYRLQARTAMDSGSNAFEILPYLMRLREICDDPALFVENYNGGSGKMETLEQIFDDYLSKGHRILLFSQFVKALEEIEALLKKKGISFYKITGDTSAQERIQLMERFNAGHTTNVFLISLKAGGTGLNLTGADTVIHFDPWWNVAAENQASDRAHRIGQTRNVEVIKLICENSVEQKVIELQNIKKDLIDKLISNSDKSVTSVSLDDVKFILK